jgi:hypothetical protein
LRSYNKNIPLLSIHVPKTGGSSFRLVLENWFSNNLYTHYPAKEVIPERAKIKTIFGQFKKGICIHGHFNRLRGFGIENHYPDIDQMICFIRNPIDQQISTFLFKHRKIKQGYTFWDWPQDKIPNDIDEFLYRFPSNLLLHLPKEITLENYIDVINERFIHLGITESYSSSLMTIASKLNKKYIIPPRKNTSNTKVFPGKKAIRFFKEKHELEFRIYELACQLNRYNR